MESIFILPKNCNQPQSSLVSDCRIWLLVRKDPSASSMWLRNDAEVDPRREKHFPGKQFLKILVLSLIMVFSFTFPGFFIRISPAQEPMERSQIGPAWDRELQVAQVIIEGAEKLKRQEIEKVMHIKTPSFKTVLKRKQIFDEETLKEDIQNIERLYWAAGYYSIQISYQWEVLNGNEITIDIHIKEGEPTLVQEIDFDIQEKGILSFKENFREIIPIKVGAPFVLEEYEKAKELIYRFLANRGYALAAVEGEALVSREKEEARLVFQVKAGPQVYISKIAIQGNESISERLICRELTFEEGHLFSLTKIQESQKKLYDTRLFRTAIISFNREIHHGNQIDILIHITERKMRSFKFGAGYGTDDQLRGLIGWTHRNFGQAGGELQVTGKASSLIRQLEGSFRQPYFPDKKSQLFLSSLVEQEIQPSYVLDKFTNKLRISRKLTPNSEGYWGYNLDFNRLREVSPLTAAAVHEIPEDFTLNSFMTFGISRDNTDDLFYPTRGNAESLVVELSSSLLGSQEEYVKVKTDFKTYYKLVGDTILAFRVALGLINPFYGRNEVPLFVRFFSGGSNSIRGYPYQKLGPLDPEEKPLGGNSLLEGSLEIRFPIWKKIHGVVFADAGSLSQGVFHYPINELKYTVGLGIRYQTLIGPIRLDIGHPLNPDITLDEYRVHVSIGQAF